MTGYTVKPMGVVSPFKNGGFVVYEAPPAYRIGVQMKDAKSNEVALPDPGGIAEKAGLLSGDKIISINDIPLDENYGVFELINKIENKDKLCVFKVERAGDILTINILPVLKNVGLVVAITDIDYEPTFDLASWSCNKLDLNGYSDWRLPSKAELNLIYHNLKQYGIGGFKNDRYWSSTRNEYGGVYVQMFISKSINAYLNGVISGSSTSDTTHHCCRAVRQY